MHHSMATASLAAVLLVSGFTAIADDGVEQSGKGRFLEHCAVCHGPGAKGDGPFANMTKTKPTDLTQLAKQNKGEFPFGHAYDTIDGRNMLVAHGTRDMPI